MTEPMKIICDIIKTQLSLNDSQVVIYNQKYNIPTSKGIYVFVSYVSGKPIGNVNRAIPTETGMDGEVSLAMAETLQIDIMSQDSSARTHKEEVLMALVSDYAQQKMQDNSIKISILPTSFIDTSFAEGSAMLNRYTTTLILFASYTNTKAIPYYDTFEQVEVHVNE